MTTFDYALDVIGDPAEEPVTLPEALFWLREDHQTDETKAVVEALIKAARTRAEMETNRAFVTQTLRLTMDGFPPSRPGDPMGAESVIRLPRPPIQSVTSIVYLDAQGVEQTLATTEYLVDARSLPARIVPAYGKSWPSIYDQINALTVTYIAGYGAAADVPDELKLAIKLMAAHWYNNREEVATYRLDDKPIPLGACAILRGYWTGEYR